MLRKNIFLLRSAVLIAATLVVSSCGGGGHKDRNNELAALLDSSWNAFGETHPGVKGSIGIVIRQGRHEYYAAAADPFEGGQDAHIRGASTTKTFTGAAIMLLHQEGRLNIDDHLTDMMPGSREPYLPDTADYAIPYKDQITIRQLLNHRGGVFDVANSKVPADRHVPYAGKLYMDYVQEDLGQMDHTFTFDELSGVVASNHLFYTPPGGPFHYSDTGYGLLGKIIERVSGLRYHAFLEEHFLSPLHLGNTSFPHEGTIRFPTSPYIPGFSWYQGQVYPAEPENYSCNVAEGNVETTPADLSRWIQALLEGKAGLNQDTLALMEQVEPTGEHHALFGLGLVETPGLGYGHDGGHAGYMTVMRYNPKNQVSVVAFISVMDFDAMYDEVDFMYDVARQAVAIATQ